MLGPHKMNTQPSLRTPTLVIITSIAIAIAAPAACSSASLVSVNPDGGGANGGDAASGEDGASTDGGGGGGDGSSVSDTGPKGDASAGGKVIFVIPMENKGQAQIYGDMINAPYINKTLMVAYPHTTNFGDELPALVSEPHYVWMESGNNSFSDHVFSGDSDPSATNSTSSTAHLVTQLQTAGISWMSYQEDITAGTCPVASAGFYACKHDPFVFFQDVSGSPPSAANAGCASHHKPLTALTTDLQNKTVAAYNFITPDLCHDMHGASGCPQANTNAGNIKAGDDWLRANLPPIIDYAMAHNGYVFVTWDEGDATNLIPFIAIGKNAIAGRAGTVAYTHSSLLKSEEEILGVPVLAAATSASDFSDLFTSFP